jgi:hypothetical protein
MKAQAGDELVVRGRHVSDEDRAGTITEVHGADGTPTYLVRWRDLRACSSPSADTVVEHHPVPRPAG